jgi:pimeloyl-ACP methyl ester carboxylesterase
MNVLRKYLFGAIVLFVNLPVCAETVVLVHGGWSGGWAMKPLANEISKRGHEIYRPSLTGLGARAHLSSTDIRLETHIQDIVNLILYEDLHDVVLVGHSYGGMVISGVSDRVPGRIARRIYIEGMVPSNGESMLDIHSKAAKVLPSLTRNGFVYPPRFTESTPPPKLMPQPLNTVTDKITLTHHNLTIPTKYVLTVASGTQIEQDDFYAQAQRAQHNGWVVINIVGGHNIQRENPELLAGIILGDPID